MRNVEGNGEKKAFHIRRFDGVPVASDHYPDLRLD